MQQHLGIQSCAPLALTRREPAQLQIGGVLEREKPVFTGAAAVLYTHWGLIEYHISSYVCGEKKQNKLVNGVASTSKFHTMQLREARRNRIVTMQLAGSESVPFFSCR